MKASAELYHADNVFRFPEMIEIKLYIVQGYVYAPYILYNKACYVVGM